MKNSATELLLSVGKFIKKIYLPFIFSPMRCSPLSLREIKKLYTNIFNWWIEKTPKPTEDTTLSLLSFLFSDFPNKSSHVYNYVDCFGAHGSGLATYETQSKTINKDIENYKYEAINNIVNRLHLLYIPGLDKVTFVMNKIAGFTVKIQNVVKYGYQTLFIYFKL